MRGCVGGLSGGNFGGVTFNSLTGELCTSCHSSKCLESCSGGVVLGLLGRTSDGFRNVISSNTGSCTTICDGMVCGAPMSRDVRSVLNRDIPFCSLTLNNLMSYMTPSFGNRCTSSSLVLETTTSNACFYCSFVGTRSSRVLSAPLGSLAGVGFRSAVSSTAGTCGRVGGVAATTGNDEVCSRRCVARALSIARCRGNMGMCMGFTGRSTMVSSMRMPTGTFAMVKKIGW